MSRRTRPHKRLDKHPWRKNGVKKGGMPHTVPLTVEQRKSLDEYVLHVNKVVIPEIEKVMRERAVATQKARNLF